MNTFGIVPSVITEEWKHETDCMGYRSTNKLGSLLNIVPSVTIVNLKVSSLSPRIHIYLKSFSQKFYSVF